MKQIDGTRRVMKLVGKRGDVPPSVIERGLLASVRIPSKLLASCA